MHRDRLSNVDTPETATLAALPVDVKAWTCPASEENCWPAALARLPFEVMETRVAYRLTGIRWDELRTVTSVSRYFDFLCAAPAGAGMSLYGSSKAAINLLTKPWAAEYSPSVGYQIGG